MQTSHMVHRGEHSTKVFLAPGKIPRRIPGKMPRIREWHEGISVLGNFQGKCLAFKVQL